MHQQASPIDVLSSVQFQLSLLQISSLGAEMPQVEELESLLKANPGMTLRPKQ